MKRQFHTSLSLLKKKRIRKFPSLTGFRTPQPKIERQTFHKIQKDEPTTSRDIYESIAFNALSKKMPQFTRYRLDAFSSTELDDCLAHLKKKQDGIYQELNKVAEVVMEDCIQNDIQQSFTDSFQPTPMAHNPLSLLTEQRPSDDLLIQSGFPFKAYKENVVLKAFLAYINHTNVFSVVPLPYPKKRVTVLKSPHVNKTAMEQFETRGHRKILVCSPYLQFFHDELVNELAFQGVKAQMSTVQLKDEFSS